MSPLGWSKQSDGCTRRRSRPADRVRSEKVAVFLLPADQRSPSGAGAERGEGIIQRLPFVPLSEEEIARWLPEPSTGACSASSRTKGFSSASRWSRPGRGFSTYEHILGVAGLSLWIGRQLAKVVPWTFRSCTAPPSARHRQVRVRRRRGPPHPAVALLLHAHLVPGPRPAEHRATLPPTTRAGTSNWSACRWRPCC